MQKLTNTHHLLEFIYISYFEEDQNMPLWHKTTLSQRQLRNRRNLPNLSNQYHLNKLNLRGKFKHNKPVYPPPNYLKTGNMFLSCKYNFHLQRSPLLLNQEKKND